MAAAQPYNAAAAPAATAAAAAGVPPLSNAQRRALAACWTYVYWTERNGGRWRFAVKAGLPPRAGYVHVLEDAIRAAMASRRCTREQLWKGPGAPPPPGQAEQWQALVAPLDDDVAVPEPVAPPAAAMLGAGPLFGGVDAPDASRVLDASRVPVVAPEWAPLALWPAGNESVETVDTREPDCAPEVDATITPAAVALAVTTRADEPTPVTPPVRWRARPGSPLAHAPNALSPLLGTAPPKPSSWCRIVAPPVALPVTRLVTKLARFRVLCAVYRDVLWSDLDDLIRRRQGLVGPWHGGLGIRVGRARNESQTEAACCVSRQEWRWTCTPAILTSTSSRRA